MPQAARIASLHNCGILIMTHTMDNPGASALGLHYSWASDSIKNTKKFDTKSKALMREYQKGIMDPMVLEWMTHGVMEDPLTVQTRLKFEELLQGKAATLPGLSQVFRKVREVDVLIAVCGNVLIILEKLNPCLLRIQLLQVVPYFSLQISRTSRPRHIQPRNLLASQRNHPDHHPVIT